MTDDWFDFIAALLDAEARFQVLRASGHAVDVQGSGAGDEDRSGRGACHS